MTGSDSDNHLGSHRSKDIWEPVEPRSTADKDLDADSAGCPFCSSVASKPDFEASHWIVVSRDTS